MPSGADSGADGGTTNGFDVVRLGEIDLSVGETEIITFDMTNDTVGDAATFSVGTAPSVGSLVVNDANAGTFTYTITEAEWIAAGSPATVTMRFADDYFTGSQPGPIQGSFAATYELTITCFGRGTEIATPSGSTPVEQLAIGDLIVTARGDIVPVKWVGRQTVNKLFAGPQMEPVRIKAGALGADRPETDLIVTANHGMVLDGYVINAGALVNGTTINWVPLAELPDRVTYYHVETEAHDVILANGAPAETYVDIPGRMAFDNYKEYLDLYGAERIIPEMRAPRIVSSRLLPQSIKEQTAVNDTAEVA